MFPNSTILGPLFWIAMGLIYALAFAGARIWFDELGLKLNWWKWVLATLWYIILSISVAGSFTLFGENEVQAGFYFLGVFVTISIILGIGLWRILISGRGKRPAPAKK